MIGLPARRPASRGEGRCLELGYCHQRAKPFYVLARLEGFEPPAYGLEVRSSIHLSYRRLAINCTTSLSFRQGQILDRQCMVTRHLIFHLAPAPLGFTINELSGISNKGVSNIEERELQEIAVMGVQCLDAMVAK